MHPYIQLQQFARSEFERGLEGLTEEDAQFRAVKSDGSQMNCISWTICHLSHQEWSFYVSGQGDKENPRLAPYATGAPATVPTLTDALDIWTEVRQAADPWLARATDADLATTPLNWFENAGTCVMRNALHYMFHAGEVNAIRQLRGHGEIIFVGTMLGRLEYPLT